MNFFEGPNVNPAMCMQCGCLVDAIKKKTHIKFHKKIERLINGLEQLEQQKQ